MPVSDFFIVLQWWSVLFLIGACAFPITKKLFSSWFDQGYLFSKAIGFALVSYLVYLAGTLHIAPFTQMTIAVSMGVVFGIGIMYSSFQRSKATLTSKQPLVLWIARIGFEELGFFLLLLLWSFVKAHEPSIRGLEKFMDYGFMQSILNTQYFPASDMWWVGGSINYYYFGHLVTAVLTKLSGLDLGYTFNLMLASLFALTASMSFSIGVQLVGVSKKTTIRALVSGGITAFVVTLAGNMQTLYAFTKGYTGDNVQPFWTLFWSLGEWAQKLEEGMLTYWYANATRFIPFSIHEFPSYSFVVSDVHGHVLSLPFVFLSIALFISFFSTRFQEQPTTKTDAVSKKWVALGSIGFVIGIVTMTNALDGPIYGFLFAVLYIAFLLWIPAKKNKQRFLTMVYEVGAVALTALVTIIPFLWHFDSFATGIGVNCPPAFLSNMRFGPILFEGVEKCQKSPLWMLWILWGFFWFSGTWLFVSKLWKKDDQNNPIVRILKVFFLCSIVLILFPEYLYVKDIYPMHFRSNTMFKLGYQAFILWSLVSGYVLTHIIWMKKNTLLRTIVILLFIPQLFLVSIYPLFSVRSYFGELKTYHGIWGLEWLEHEYQDDWNVIEWLKQQQEQGTVVEAAGDSYTDYNHISAFTGIPTITGWAVHEWLWRGSFDIVSPRQEAVRIIYESRDINETKEMLDTYGVTYIVVGKLEREKYKNLQEWKFRQLGTIGFTSNTTTVYKITSP